MVVKLEKTSKDEYVNAFRSNHAVVIGINHYGSGIQPLTTPVNDARRLAQQLEEEHGYTVHLLVEDVTKERLENYFTAELPSQIGEDDRLLLYFAGHGVALDGDDGPQGFLVPQDADPKERDSFLPMTELHGWLDALECRHMLAILDCCFAGTFRWAAMRHMGALPEVIHKERFDRYLASPAWQVLTSAAYDQKALDAVGVSELGARGVRETDGERHSPFALALYKALRGEGDLIPKGDGDGVITATELYLYLREEVEVKAEAQANHEQTPGLWPLNKHGRGEYIFLSPGHELNLPPAPDLTEELNPWRGLKSYNQEHRELFFGRDQEIDELCARVHDQPFTAVLGASGTGKSSLVKAGLLPDLAAEGGWHVLPPLRPGATPLLNLRRLLATELSANSEPSPLLSQLPSSKEALAGIIGEWKEHHPQSQLLLMVDQLEELVTLAGDETRQQFLDLLAAAVEAHPDTFRLVITLRTDFEPQFNADSPLAAGWNNGRYIVPPMDQADLRQVIEGPAAVRVLYFEPPELVDALITEVIQTPGALPLLSFTLSEMYIHYVKSGRDNRALTGEDYEALGGVIGSLRTRANEEYNALPDDAHREMMQKLMLRMISVEGGELARRRVLESELVYTDEAGNKRVRTVLDRLVEARLLVTGEEEGQPTVEPAHDALVLAWDRLLRWKKEAESYLPLQRRVAQAAVEWESAEESAQSGMLWDDDPRLPQLEETLWPTGGKKEGLGGRARWARQVLLPNTRTPADAQWLNDAEVAFVQSSVKERAKFWRRTTGLALAIFLIVSALSTFGFNQQQQSSANLAAAATEQALRATAVVNEQIAVEAQATAVAAQATSDINAALASTRESEARAAEAEVQMLKNSIQASQLAAAAGIEIEENQELALLLATTGLGLNVQPDTLSRFFDANFLPFRRSIEANLELISSIDFSPDGKKILATGDNGAKVWDLKGNLLISLDGHTDRINTGVFNPNGQKVLTAGSDGSAIVWDLGSGEQITLDANDVSVKSATFSRNGQLILTAGCDVEDGLCSTSSVKVWDSDGNQLLAFEDIEGGITLADFSPNGQLIVADGGGMVRLWDLDGDQLASVGQDIYDIFSPRFSSDSQSFLTSDSTGDIQIWDLDGNNLASFRAHQRVYAASFSPNGQFVVTAGCDEIMGGGFGCNIGSARLWDLEGNELASLDGHQDDVLSAIFSPDGSRIITSGCDTLIGSFECPTGSATVWDTAGNELTSLDSHEGRVSAAIFDPAGRLVATVGSDDSIKLWVLDGREQQTSSYGTSLNGHEDGLHSANFSPDGRKIVTTSGDGSAKIWGLTGNELLSIEGLGDDLRSAIFSPDGKHIVTVSNPGGARIWDLDGNELASLKKHDGLVKSAVFSPDGQHVLTAGCEMNVEVGCNAGSATVWDMAGNELASLEGHDGVVSSANFSPDGRYIITASQDGSTKVWDLTGNELVSLDDFEFGTGINPELVDDPNTLAPPEYELGIDSAIFSPDGQYILTASLLGSVRIWDLEGNELATLEGHDNWVSSASFSPDGQTVVTAGCPQVGGHRCSVPFDAKVWDLEGNEIATLGPLSGMVDSASYSPDGNLIVTIDNVDSVRLWDSVGNELALLKGHQSYVTSTSFSPDGDFIVTASNDNTAIVWPLFPKMAEIVARQRLGDEGEAFSEDECRRYFTDDLQSCPRTLEELWDFFEDDLE